MDLADNDSKYVYRITIRILGLDIMIPLFTLFRCFGLITDKEIINMIIYRK